MDSAAAIRRAIEFQLLRDPGGLHRFVGGNPGLVQRLVARDLLFARRAIGGDAIGGQRLFAGDPRGLDRLPRRDFRRLDRLLALDFQRPDAAILGNPRHVHIGGLRDAQPFRRLARGDLGFLQCLRPRDLAAADILVVGDAGFRQARSCAIRAVSTTSRAAISACSSSRRR